jgi:glycosyltransferase involved in cell wall biosynthesis
VQALLDEGLDLEVTFAGGVADRAVHAGMLRQVRYPERVRFAGSVDAAGKCVLLSSAHVLALPSYYENEAHPLVILEAMAAGLPVVSTRHGAIPEAVSDGRTGILVAPRDVTGLTGALRQLARDPALRARLGGAGRTRYEEHFTVERWADRMTDVFCRAMVAV